MSADTPLDIEVELDRLFRERSGADRVRMACDMFDCARMIAVSAIRAKRPEISEVDLRLALFDRIYGDDYGEEERTRIRSRLAAWGDADTPR